MSSSLGENSLRKSIFGGPQFPRGIIKFPICCSYCHGMFSFTQNSGSKKCHKQMKCGDSAATAAASNYSDCHSPLERPPREWQEGPAPKSEHELRPKAGLRRPQRQTLPGGARPRPDAIRKVSLKNSKTSAGARAPSSAHGRHSDMRLHTTVAIPRVPWQKL